MSKKHKFKKDTRNGEKEQFSYESIKTTQSTTWLDQYQVHNRQSIMGFAKNRWHTLVVYLRHNITQLYANLFVFVAQSHF